ncbi:glycosyltransferase family 4 protein [Mesorhizobium sp.]|nr:glycosyltransferase family 4 protein [Mesorhizobium sp.]RWO85987.1 MAG: glycosyltransferase family 1 protein [Mesorhizobium sp.]RWQ54693.1 MAG: glycosyltransferase family 1 protein [Mesorhizobium sp.]
MRVLMVHNFYQIRAGEDSVVREELACLKQNGVEVELFSATNDDIVRVARKISTALGVVYNSHSRRALSRKLAEFSPDVVHIHNFFPLLSPSILDACREAGVPSVMTLHNFRILCPSSLLYPDERLRERSLRHACWWTVPKKVYRNSLAGTLALAAMVEFHKRAGTWSRKVERFIALTDWARRKLVEGGLPAERIVVKPNAVARPPIFGDLRRNGGLFVGRLDEHHKGVATLLEAWKEIDYPLRIIGDGPLAPLVEQSACERVEYLGRQSRETVLKEMHAAAFLLFPSKGYELFPMTVIEAFASRLPVICSDLPWIKGVVEPDVTGLVVPVGNAGALADRVRWALSNRSALEEVAGRAYAAYQEQYTPEANFNRLMAIYEPLVRRRIRAFAAVS